MSETMPAGDFGDAIPESGRAPPPQPDGFVWIGDGVVFHLDVLKLTSPEGDASAATFDVGTEKQMSLDLEDLA
jgi:hypothetical protein